MRTFEYISNKAAKTRKSWSNIERINFHYFNPNGLVGRKWMNDARINKLVDDGVVRPGWILAYGTFANFQTKQVENLLANKRISHTNYRVAIGMLREQCEEQEAKIAEVS